MMNVDGQLTLLRMAAMVDPHLRQAVQDVEDALRAERDRAERLWDVIGHATDILANSPTLCGRCHLRSDGVLERCGFHQSLFDAIRIEESEAAG